jgi:hypothetical protein
MREETYPLHQLFPEEKSFLHLERNPRYKQRMTARTYKGTRRLWEVSETLAAPAFRARGFVHTRLLLEWEQVVGSALAKVTRPHKLTFTGETAQGGTLHLLVASGWGPELHYMTPLLLEKIAGYFGYPAVTKIRLCNTHLPQ